MKLTFTEAENKAIDYAAFSLGVKREWLVDLIRFESAWNPTAENKYTGARGLIQFMPATASGLGFPGTQSIKDGRPTAADNLIKVAPDITSQLYYVVKYLEKYKPFPTLQSLYMSVFYPKYRNVAQTTAFPDSVQKVNPGIKTVADYMRRASPLARAVAPMLLCAIGATVFF
jgi:hypothetical protein